jgi:hypothetical protein
MENYVKLETISIKDHETINEKWIQDKISEDPGILGLGDLQLKDKERIQPSGGRLDLLLKDPENDDRYEVEIQLGKTDESHIIRTIEYWDSERKRYPMYDHYAVLIAEDITSRFLNVISLFNGSIPFIAIQMKAIKIENNISLFFTIVMDVFDLGTDEDEEDFEPADRKYWETKGSKESLNIVDELLSLSNSFAPGYALNYTKHYVGVAKDGISQNFVSFVPKKTTAIINIKHKQNDDIDKLIKESDLDVLTYDKQWKQYRIRMKTEDIKINHDVLITLMKKAFESYMK